MLQESRLRLAARGLTSSDVLYEVTTSNGSVGTDPTQPVLRGNGIQLLITYPYQRLFEIDRLVGISPPDSSSRMIASGMKMSEYVP
jgi:hypothetical protein